MTKGVDREVGALSSPVFVRTHAPATRQPDLLGSRPDPNKVLMERSFKNAVVGTLQQPTTVARERSWCDTPQIPRAPGETCGASD
jgi:hypothetical protein